MTANPAIIGEPRKGLEIASLSAVVASGTMAKSARSRGYYGEVGS
jgi:hypothetical protein